MATQQEFIVRLSAIDQSVPRGYIRLALCYKHKGTKLLTIAHRLDSAAKQTITRFPVLAGVVRPATDSITTPQGRLEIVTTLDRVAGFKPLIKSNVGLPGVLSYDALEAAQMPALQLINEAMAPLADTPTAQETPAFAIQATMIAGGGLIVALYLHHAVGDLSTLRMIIDDLSSERQSNELSEEALRGDALQQSGQRDRLAGPNGLRALFAEESRFRNFSNTMTRQLVVNIDINAPGNTCCLFSFDITRLENLKALLNGRITGIRRGNGPTVTSFAVLAAIMWKAVTRARIVRGLLNVDENEARRQTSALVTAVNFRNRIASMGDEDYFGNAIVEVFANQMIQNLAIPLEPVGIETAAQSVATATSSVFEGRVRSTIAAINAAADVSKVEMKGMRVSSDLAVLSWADLKLNQATLGLQLGGAEWSRQMSSSENTFIGCIVHPKRVEAGLWDVTVQLPLGTVQRMRQDESFMRYVRHYA